MSRAISDKEVSIPKIYDDTRDKPPSSQGASFSIGTFVCFMGFNNKSAEMTIVGIIYMFEAFLTLDYGQFTWSTLSPLFGLLPMLLRNYAFPSFSSNPGERIIVEKVEK